MHEIIESEMLIDINGITVVITKSVAEEGHDCTKGTVLIGEF